MTYSVEGLCKCDIRIARLGSHIAFSAPHVMPNVCHVFASYASQATGTHDLLSKQSNLNSE